MFDISYFSQDPRPFFKFAKDIYPGKFKPSPCHKFIKLLEKHQKLLRNYTQNIDTLEKEAIIERVIECHGSFATATCTKCDHKVGADKIRDIVLSQKIPMCEVCHGDKEISVSTDDFGSEGTDYKVYSSTTISLAYISLYTFYYNSYLKPNLTLLLFSGLGTLWHNETRHCLFRRRPPRYLSRSNGVW